MSSTPNPSLLILGDRHKAAFAFGGMAQAMGILLFGWGFGGWSSVVLAVAMLLVALKQTTLVFPSGVTVAIDKSHRPVPWLSVMFFFSGLSNLAAGLANDLPWHTQAGIGSLLIALGALMRSRYLNAAPLSLDDMVRLPQTR